MDRQQRPDGFVEVGDRFSGYNVYDLFVDEADQPEYIGVKMGFLGLRSTLIPWDLVTPDESAGRLVVATDKDTAKNGPTFDDDREITPEFEHEIHSYYGITGAATAGTGSYSSYYPEETTGTTGTAGAAGTVGIGMTMGDTESGSFEPHGPGQEGVGVDDDKSDLEDEDELRVQRSEEELRAGTRERQAGAVNVRKRVRVDRERLEVPTRREEVSVERVPVNEEAPSGAVIGEDEVVVPVVEEEVVVEKRPGVKEEMQLRKDVVEETQVVEDEMRKEEVDIEDATTTRRDQNL